MPIGSNWSRALNLHLSISVLSQFSVRSHFALSQVSIAELRSRSRSRSGPGQVRGKKVRN